MIATSKTHFYSSEPKNLYSWITLHNSNICLVKRFFAGGNWNAIKCECECNLAACCHFLHFNLSSMWHSCLVFDAWLDFVIAFDWNILLECYCFFSCLSVLFVGFKFMCRFVFARRAMLGRFVFCDSCCDVNQRTHQLNVK